MKTSIKLFQVTICFQVLKILDVKHDLVLTDTEGYETIMPNELSIRIKKSLWFE